MLTLRRFEDVADNDRNGFAQGCARTRPPRPVRKKGVDEDGAIKPAIIYELYLQVWVNSMYEKLEKKGKPQGRMKHCCLLGGRLNWYDAQSSFAAMFDLIWFADADIPSVDLGVSLKAVHSVL